MAIPGQKPNDLNKYSAKVQNVQTQNNKNSTTDDNRVYENLNLNDYVIEYENILLKYSNWTYHFTLYALDKDDFVNFWKYPNMEVQKYVIAESGVTGKYNITSVQMVQAGPSTPGMTTNYSFNTATLNMSENNSMSLYDELIALSNKLRYHKFMDVPLILELKFIGYTEDGKPEVIPTTEKKWSVRINSVKANASETGSTMLYSMALVHNRTSLVDNIDWTLKENFACVSSNFGDFCYSLEDKLNEMSEQQYGYLRYQYPALADGMFFEFRIAPDLENMFINYDSKQMSETTQTSKGDQGSKNLSWNPSTPVSRILDDVIDNCTVYEGDSTSVRQFIHLVPVKQYVGFDQYRNTSVYKIIFYVIKYKIGDIVHESDLTPENFNFEYFYENAVKYVDPRSGLEKMNMKVYDFMFSGLNDEILDLDLNFDQQFFVATTRNPGPIQDLGNRAGTHNSQELTIQGVQYKNVAEAWAKTNDIRRAIQQGGMVTEAQQATIQAVDEAAQKAGMQVGNQEEQDSYNNYKVNVLTEYIEDYRTDYTETDNNDLVSQQFTMPTEATNNETTLSGSINDNSSTYEMDRRKIRDNYYNRPFLCRIDMKVIGDPYWLGWSDFSYLQYIDQVVNGKDIELNPEDFHTANYLTSEAYFLLNLQPVISISDNTGVLDVNTPTTFNSTIYRVNRIVSDFGDGGTFTQQVQGAIVARALKRRDSVINK